MRFYFIQRYFLTGTNIIWNTAHVFFYSFDSFDYYDYVKFNIIYAILKEVSIPQCNTEIFKKQCFGKKIFVKCDIKYFSSDKIALCIHLHFIYLNEMNKLCKYK